MTRTDQAAREVDDGRFPPVMPDGKPYRLHNSEGSSAILLTCDHASPALPLEYGTLGLPPDVFYEHVAYDIGAAELTVHLADALDAIAVLANFSRLLIDPNREPHHETLVPKESDRIEIPANQRADEAEIAKRRRDYFDRYHDAVDAQLALLRGRDQVPIVAGIHSFVPIMQGAGRPWHAGILWNKDPRLARFLLDNLRHDPDLSVGDNLPYSGKVLGHGMNAHGGKFGYPHAVIEVRQDLISDAGGIDEWCGRLAPILARAEKEDALSRVEHFD